MSGDQVFETPMNQRDLIFLDCETSGLDPDFHEMIEFAAVRVTHDFSKEKGVVDMKLKMLHPERATKEALEVNRYDPREWMNAAHPRLFCVSFRELIGDGEAIMIGHNPRFDENFARATYKRESLAYPEYRYLIDTASIAWPLARQGVLEKINLESLCARYGVPNSGSHRALADVRRTMMVYRKLVGMREPS